MVPHRQGPIVFSIPDSKGFEIDRYAAYGSNLHPLRLGERVPSSRLIGTAFVAHFSLRFHKRSADSSAKCGIETPGEGVYVAVYEMSRADKALLDRIEGVGQGYAEQTIAVPGFDLCATYVAEPNYIDESLQPYDWYLELVLLGCRYLEFPEPYIASIAAVESIPDPDHARRQQNVSLIERIRRGTLDSV